MHMTSTKVTEASVLLQHKLNFRVGRTGYVTFTQQHLGVCMALTDCLNPPWLQRSSFSQRRPYKSWSPWWSPAATTLLIGRSALRGQRMIVRSGFLSYLHVEMSDTEEHIAAVFPFNLQWLKCKHPHRRTLIPFQCPLIIVYFFINYF